MKLLNKQEFLKSLNESNEEMKNALKTDWIYGGKSGVMNMECDHNFPATIYTDNESEASVGVYNEDDTWHLFIEDPNGDKTRNEVIDSFEDGIKFMKKFLQLPEIKFEEGKLHLNESVSKTEELVKTVYDIEEPNKKGQILVKPKDGSSMPFRITTKEDKFIVSEGSRERTYLPMTFRKVKEASNMEEVYSYLVKSWNKTAKIDGMNRKTLNESNTNKEIISNEIIEKIISIYEIKDIEYLSKYIKSFVENKTASSMNSIISILKLKSSLSNIKPTNKVIDLFYDEIMKNKPNLEKFVETYIK